MSARANTAPALPPLPADIFEAFVAMLAGALVDDLRADLAAEAVKAPRGTDREAEQGRDSLTLAYRNGERVTR